MRQVPLAVVPAERSSEMIPLLKSKGFVDLSARITKQDGLRYIPILESAVKDVEAMGITVSGGPAYSEASRPPMERILATMSFLSEQERSLLPDKWEIAGDVATVKLDRSLYKYADLLGKAYADAIGVSSVLADVSGVSGEFRVPDMRLLYGHTGESIKVQNRIKYCFDVTKVMFASGNLVERGRMETLDCRGETVVDMFAGIGYFTLPLAKFSGAKKVFACEKNPDSYRFLVKNIALNEVQDIVVPLLGDNRDIAGKGFADRILMGYVQTTSLFVPKALSMAKKGCIIHYHDTFPTGKESENVNRIFTDNCGPDGYEILSIREVKSFAPSVSHYVADVKVF